MPSVILVLFIVTFFPMILAFIGRYLRYKHVISFDNRTFPESRQSETNGFALVCWQAQKNAWEGVEYFITAVLTLRAFYSSVNSAGTD